MKLKIALLVVAFVFGLSYVGMAETTTSENQPASKQVQNIKKKDMHTVSKVTRMMAHLSFAAQAIDLKMKSSALKNLAQAKELCTVIEKSRPELISEYVYKFGKTTDVVENVSRDYYVPVSDDVFLEGQFDEKNIWVPNPKVDTTSTMLTSPLLKPV